MQGPVNMSDATDTPTNTVASADTISTEPTQAEIDAWVEREKQRRQAWLAGPSDDERADYASRLRRRNLADRFGEGEERLNESMRMGIRYSREAQLAAEGAVALIYRFTRKTFAELVEAGRQWEEETSLPPRRRRVPIDDDQS
jgi:hypothetical protein